MAEAFHRFDVTRVRAGVRTNDRDRAATEEPLEVRLHNINASLMNGLAEALELLLAGRRNVTANSSCGMCGRLTIDSLRADAPALVVPWTVPADTLIDLPDGLRRAQSVFEETGGLHAAGLFTYEGKLETIAEDVGGHNAVDKVIGRMLIEERLPLCGAVSAPSSLAIDLAVECGITLIGFLRGSNFNIYAHPERVTT
jgi:FdhD protein